jgi:hypothetical protein
MKSINKNNYEAFYLDFLEGNLDQDRSAELLAFLEEHPDYQVEIEEYLTVESKGPLLDASFKQTLKQVIFEEDTISLLNIESFLIAHTEGILSTKKEAELSAFIAFDPLLLREQKLFDATVLKVNETEVFESKPSLKKFNRVALWPFAVGAVAAGLTLLFSLGNLNFSGDSNVSSSQPSSVEKVKIQKSNQPQFNPTSAQSVDQKTDGAVVSPGYHPVIESNRPQALKEKERVNEDKVVGELAVLAPKFFEVGDELDDPEPSAVYVSHRPSSQNPNNSYVMLGFQDMKNPIEPFTSHLASAIKREVDFRTIKPTSMHSGGFYLKIGKLVVSRKSM